MATVSISGVRGRSLAFPPFGKRFVILVMATAFLTLFGAQTFAQEVSVDSVAASVKETTTAINIMWMLICGFLVFFMQAGFALVETGFTRTKNVAHTMMMNMMVFCIGAVGYWLLGFALQFGSVNEAYPAVATAGAVAGEWAHSPLTLGDWGSLLSTSLLKIGQWGFVGGSGFLLVGLAGNTGVLAYFLFQMVFMDTAATIPTGSMAERLKFPGFVIMGLWVSMIVYPIAGNWIWGADGSRIWAESPVWAMVP